MVDFDPVEWTQRFERMGGIVTFRHADNGTQLWTGVIRLNPEDGAEAEVMRAELENRPDWQSQVSHYARERLGAVHYA
jgi:hypothetical protein